MPPTRSARTLWARLGRGVAESAPVARCHALLRHQWLTDAREFLGDLRVRLGEILHPVVLVARGIKRVVTGAKGWWEAGSPRKRRIQAGAVGGAALLIALAPYGPVLLILGALGWVGWLGRDRSARDGDPESEAHVARLQAVYNGLVPYLHDEHDPDQHFKPGGGYRDAFTSWEFDEQDRLTGFTLDYSEYVRDGEAECRAKVERAIEGKVGRGNEFLYDWDEEGNHLAVRVLPPLPSGLAAQPWPVAEIEYVLGITDPDSAGRLIPVLLPEEPGVEPEPVPAHLASRAAPPPEGWRTAAVAPVIWRVGSPCPHPHLLVTGPTGSGHTTLVRSLLSQALGRGQQVAVIDVEQTEAYDDLVGRHGVRGVVEDAERALELLDWFGLECERRAEKRRARVGAAEEGGGAAGKGVGHEAMPAAQLPWGGTAVRMVAAAEPAAASLAASLGAPRVGGPSGGGRPGAEAEAAAETSAQRPEQESAPERAEPTLWLCVDGLPELLDAATRLGRPNLEDTIAALARKARYADVMLIATARQERVLHLRPALRAQMTVRVAMGAVEPSVSTALFGGTLELGGSRLLPPGRGYVRVGNGPVIRLQTPYTPPGDVAPLREVGTDQKAAQRAALAPTAG